MAGNSSGRKIDLYLDSYACFPFGLESAPQNWLKGVVSEVWIGSERLRVRLA